MIEIGHRNPNPAVLAKLADLEIQLSRDNSARSRAVTEKQSAAVNNMLRTRAEWCTLEATIINYKLEAKRIQYRKCLKTIEITSVLLDAPATDKEEDKKDRLCLEIMQAAALKKMRTCGMEVQARLQLKADALTYRAQQAQAGMV